MTGLEIYLMIILPLHAVDEAYNCNNIPISANSKEMHLVCNWTEDDYEWYTDDNGRMGYRLKEYSQTDNYFEKRARDKYWNNNKQENTQ